MKLQLQTKLVIAAYSALLISIFIPIHKLNDPNIDNNNEYNLKHRIKVLLMMLLPISASIYTIQCMVKGKCEVWAWYNSITIFIWCIFVLIISIMNIKI